MLTDLIESGSHARARKRSSLFFIVTLGCYGVLLLTIGAASIYAYDARLTDEWVAHVEWLTPLAPPAEKIPTPVRPAMTSVATPSTLPPSATVTMRRDAVAPTSDPTRFARTPSTAPAGVVSIPNGTFDIGNIDADAPMPPSSGVAHDGVPGSDTNGTTNEAIKRKINQPPPPPVAVLRVERPAAPHAAPRPVSKGVLNGFALTLPQPEYTAIARQAGIAGTVTVQVVIDTKGKVVTAQAVDGPALLRQSAVRAALRARFNPTRLSDVPISVQGVIKYRFSIE